MNSLQAARGISASDWGICMEMKMHDLNKTPKSDRLHIAFFGKRNAGKSSLINAVTGQSAAIVSPEAGTTADPVYKAMEINPIGPCVLIDTAGFDDTGTLGELRVEKTRKVIEAADIAVMVFADMDFAYEAKWLKMLKKKNTPILAAVNKTDILEDASNIADKIRAEFGLEPVLVSAAKGEGTDRIKAALTRLVPEEFAARPITRHLAGKGDIVLLVMPQDIQAPKGRLILPQVQTIRDLLDGKAVVMSCTADGLDSALAALKEPPKLIVTDSQVFDIVYQKKPEQSLLTSFSVLLARHKGDIAEFVRGASAIDALKETDRVLIAEACTHAPMSEDIGRVKLPRMLRKKVGEGLEVDIAAGSDFPEDLSPYALIIHCGACMFNRRYVLSRIEKARDAGVPITNYGVAIAKLKGILEKIETY